MITASTPAASAVLSKAPILPGFSGASAMRIKGFFFSIFRFDKSCSFALHMAMIPSVVER